MSYPGGPRPGTAPPNYNPNSLPDGMQNLNLNRPSGPPSSAGGPRPPPSFGQQSQFPGPSSMTRPGPPPPGVRPTFPPGGPQQSQMPQNFAPNRPSGPASVSQLSPPFGSRPSPPPGSGGPSTAPPVSRPNVTPFGSSSPMMTGGGAGGFAPSRVLGPASNGPPAFGSGGQPRFSSTGNPPQLQVGQVAPTYVRAPPPPQTMRPGLGSPPTTAVPPGGSMQQPPSPFSGPPTRSSPYYGAPPPPPAGSSPFGAPPQSAVPSSDSPYAPQGWPMQPGQVAPPPGVPGVTQPPRIFGMPPPPPNQSMATISSGLGGIGASTNSPSKVDPTQIPRPIPSSPVIMHETRLCNPLNQNQANPPPPATSNYIVKDTGNCSPRFMRCTINQIPCTADVLTTSGMQLALMVQPLALPHPSEEPIQVVDFGESGPVRCSRCKAYINPFMKFIDQGRRFICNLCGSSEETPRDYHCNLDPEGRRRDADDRPELCRGTVEFVATKEYMVRDPMPAVFFFLIDVSLNAIQTGATAAACSAINQIIADLPEGPRTFVGVATFDSTIHFYNMKRALQQPLMLIVPDVHDVYTPLQTDVIVQLSECRQHLELLLESIPNMFQNNKTADSAFGAAVKAAFLAMKDTGGKLLVFQTVLPSVGLGALSGREAEGRSNMSAADKEAHKLLQPADKTLTTMAADLAEYQVCVDIYITAQSYVDIASLSVIPRTTGGQVYYYHPFSALSDAAKLFNDLRWNVTRLQGFEAVMRVRCSQGIQVQEYSGNFCKRIPTDVDLPAIDCDKTIMVTMKHDDKMQDGSECAFQCALLYTTIYGQRRIRVSTLSLPCTSALSNMFRAADLDTQFACFLRQAANEVPSSPLTQVRERVTNLCISILFSYRKYCATVSSSTGQLILPEALKLLPLYTLALVKSVGLRNDGRIDDRSFWINHVSFLSTPLAIPLVYPRMMAIHDLDSMEIDGSLPPVVPLSSEHINDSGIYLLENGDDCLIYIGNSADPNVMQQLFGISSIDEVPSQFVLQQYDNALSKKLNDVVNEIRRQRCSYLRLKLCRKGESSGMLFLSYMVEDKTVTGLAYVEFLVHVHRQIQSKMAEK